MMAWPPVAKGPILARIGGSGVGQDPGGRDFFEAISVFPIRQDRRSVAAAGCLPLPSLPTQGRQRPPTRGQGMQSITQRIASELSVQEWQVKAAVDLLDGGATVPFIARYRKEATGTLDDVQLRTLEERLRYLRELDERREARPRQHPRAGQARRRAPRADQRGGHQGAPGRSLSALQAEAAHEGPNRHARRASSRWRTGFSPTRPGSRSTVAAGSSNGEQGVTDVDGRARRRPSDPDRTFRRRCRTDRRPARAPIGSAAA